jgi:hypothetical protein
MRLDGFVAKLSLLLALAVERRGSVEGQSNARGQERKATDSLTTMKGRPCSSFITAAVGIRCQYGADVARHAPTV